MRIEERGIVQNLYFNVWLALQFVFYKILDRICLESVWDGYRIFNVKCDVMSLVKVLLQLLDHQCNSRY